MSADVHPLREPPPHGEARAPAAMPAGRTLYWSVRRELWENRSLYMAPLAIAAVMLFGFLVTSGQLAETVGGVSALEPAKQQAVLARPYDVAAVLVMVTSVIVGWFYCLDALHGERRDRSILFWKSLPVSDFTTVAAKALIPMVVLPLIAFAIILATQMLMLLASTLILTVKGVSAAPLWTHLSLFRGTGVLLYGLAMLALWYAPIYAWLLLVSAWAQRATFLWAVLPPLAILVFERIAFGTSLLGGLLQARLAGGYAEAFTAKAASGGGKWPIPVDPSPDPIKFLGTPGLWVGLIVAMALLAAAIWLRRRREPI